MVAQPEHNESTPEHIDLAAVDTAVDMPAIDDKRMALDSTEATSYPDAYGVALDPEVSDLYKTTPSVESKFIVSPRAIAVVSVIAALACLTTLVIVGSVRDADALATTALALAVIAFGAQLLTSFTQHALTTQQSAACAFLGADR